MHPECRKSSNQTTQCFLREKLLLSIMKTQLRTPWNPSTHHSTIVLMGLREALNWVPILRSLYRTADVSFSSLFHYTKIFNISNRIYEQKMTRFIRQHFIPLAYFLILYYYIILFIIISFRVIWKQTEICFCLYTGCSSAVSILADKIALEWWHDLCNHISIVRSKGRRGYTGNTFQISLNET